MKYLLCDVPEDPWLGWIINMRSDLVHQAMVQASKPTAIVDRVPALLGNGSRGGELFIELLSSNILIQQESNIPL